MITGLDHRWSTRKLKHRFNRSLSTELLARLIKPRRRAPSFSTSFEFRLQHLQFIQAIMNLA